MPESTAAAEPAAPPTQNSPAPVPEAPVSVGFDDAAFLGPETVGVVVIRPRQLADWATYRALKNTNGFFPADFIRLKQALDLQPEQVDRITLVFSQQTMAQMATWTGRDWESALARGQMPALIVTLAVPRRISLDFLGGAKQELVAGQAVWTNGEGAVSVVGANTVVVGALGDVKTLVQTKLAGTHEPNPFSTLNTRADFTALVRLEQFAPPLKLATQKLPGVDSIGSAQTVEMRINLTGEAGEKLLQVIATTADEATARSILEKLAPVIDKNKKALLLQSEWPDMPDASRLYRQIVESTEVATTGSRIELQSRIPEGFDDLAEALQPAVQKAQAAVEEKTRQNSLKQIGLAFWNFESGARAFPAAGGLGFKGGSTGLSWRVYLLPFLDQPALYNEFNLKEPWDSEHNKKLISRMPAVFKSDGVTEDGMTSFHVFTGPGALFANDEAPRMGMMQNPDKQIMMVEAGPETAEIWTKPGGLNFDPKNPLKALGTLPEAGIRALMVSGRVQLFPATIDKKELLKMIQLQKRNLE